ncbi:hypothetical protein GCM10027563_36000 [Parasphingorhabdus pacifica]
MRKTADTVWETDPGTRDCCGASRLDEDRDVGGADGLRARGVGGADGLRARGVPAARISHRRGAAGAIMTRTNLTVVCLALA